MDKSKGGSEACLKATSLGADGREVYAASSQCLFLQTVISIFEWTGKKK